MIALDAFEFILLTLGATGDAVAAKLRAAGVRGTLGHQTCPVATHMRKIVDKSWWISVGMETITFGPIANTRRIPTPKGIREFLEGLHEKGSPYADLLTKRAPR